MRELTIYRQFFTNADCYKKHNIQIPKGIQVHSTGANAPYLRRYVQPDDGRLGVNKYNNSHNRPGLDVCANAYIGKLNDGTPAIYQTLPWDYRCWLSGSGTNGSANRAGYIGFEICEDNLMDKKYFDEAVMNLSVTLVAYLCLQYNIPLSNVHDHKELHLLKMASNHADIQHWLKKFNLTMDDYRNAVQAAIDDGIQVTYIEGNEEIKEEPDLEPIYTAKVVAYGNSYPVRMRLEPSDKAVVLKSIPQGTIVDVYKEVDGSWAYISDGGQFGYMMREFLQKQILDDEVQEDNNGIEVTEGQVAVYRIDLEDMRDKLTEMLNFVNSLLDT